MGKGPERDVVVVVERGERSRCGIFIYRGWLWCE